MKITEIKDFFNGINRPIPVPSISLDDCPSHNCHAQSGEVSSDHSDEPKGDANAPSGIDELCSKIESCCEKTNKCRCWNLLLPILAIIVLAVLGCLILSNRAKILAIDIIQNARWIHYIFIFSCFAAILVALILLSYKFFQFQSKQCENNVRLKEKMMNTVIDAFNEDREYSRLQTKTEIALHEKLERARIDEWSRNKEHERRLNVMEQERVAEFNKILLEMAKVKNTVTLSDPKGSGKTIVIERSVLSEECCNELKDIAGKHFSQEDECCKLLKEMFHCLMDGTSSQDRCKRIKELLQCLLCHDSDCDKKYKDLCNKIDQVILILSNNNIAFNPNGMPVVNNINFTKGK